MNWRRKLLFLQIESGGFGWSVQWLFLDKQKGFYLGCAIHLVTGVDVFVPAVEYQVKHLCSLHYSFLHPGVHKNVGFYDQGFY